MLVRGLETERVLPQCELRVSLVHCGSYHGLRRRPGVSSVHTSGDSAPTHLGPLGHLVHALTPAVRLRLLVKRGVLVWEVSMRYLSYTSEGARVDGEMTRKRRSKWQI